MKKVFKWQALLFIAMLVISVFPIGETKMISKILITKVEASGVSYQTTANLNLRTGPSTSYKRLTTIPKGKKVTYLSKSGSWYKVKYGSKTGYASSKYLKKVSSAKKSNTKKSTKKVSKTNNSKQYQTTTNLNMRSGASTKHKVLTTIPKGKKVTYVSKSGSWYKVKYGKRTGFVSSKYLKNPSASTNNKTKKSSSSKKGYEIPILMYHAIDEYKGNGLKELYVTPKNFKAQMQYLKSAGFTPITFEDIKRIDKIKKPILITFDDGYKNNMNAYKILKELNDSKWKAKGTIFMIGNKIDTKGGLSKKQLKEMSDSGIISIQSHTETHPSLTKTKNYNKELRDIKKKLEGITGKKVIALSYPIGHYDSKVIKETKKYYTYAVTTKPGIANTSESLYEMKRLRVSYSTSLASFKKMVN